VAETKGSASGAYRGEGMAALVWTNGIESLK
jgi:hypothetical protein